MDTILAEPWTLERFLAWEDQQESKHEFDGQLVVAMTGGSLGHQRIIINLMATLLDILGGTGIHPAQEMRLRIGQKVRYPDVTVFKGRYDRAIGALTDALVIFEVLSGDTADTDRGAKLLDYAELPSLRAYVLLEQAMVAATVFQRDGADGPLVAAPPVGATLALAPLNIGIRIADLYRGLSL